MAIALPRVVYTCRQAFDEHAASNILNQGSEEISSLYTATEPGTANKMKSYTGETRRRTKAK